MLSTEQAEIAELLPTEDENHDVEKMLNCFGDLNSVTLHLKRDDASLHDARKLFDSVLKKDSDLLNRSGKKCPIAEITIFKEEIKQVNREEENRLRKVGLCVVHNFLERETLKSAVVAFRNFKELSFAQNVLKFKRMEK